MKRLAVIILGLAVIALSAIWIAQRRSAPANPTSPAATTRVTIAQFGDFFLYLPLYVAMDHGFFAAEGIDARIINTGGDDKTWAAVLSGSAQFGVADPTFVAVSAERGQGGKVIALLVNGVPFWGVTKRADIRPISDVRQLDGRSVATFPSPSTAYTLQSDWAKQAGITMKIIEAAPGTLLPLIDAGRADIALELEPNVSTAVAGGAHVVYSLADAYGDFAITGLTASDAYLTTHPDVAQRVVRALARAEALIHADEAAALAVARKRFPDLKPEVAQNALRRAVAAGIIPQSPRVSAAGWEKAVGLRIRAGDIKTSRPMSNFVADSFAAAVETE